MGHDLARPATSEQIAMGKKLRVERAAQQVEWDALTVPFLAALKPLKDVYDSELAILGIQRQEKFQIVVAQCRYSNSDTLLESDDLLQDFSEETYEAFESLDSKYRELYAALWHKHYDGHGFSFWIGCPGLTSHPGSWFKTWDGFKDKAEGQS